MGVVESLNEVPAIIYAILVGLLLGSIFSKNRMHNIIMGTLFLISIIFWFGLISYAFDFVEEWYFRIIIIIPLLPIIMLNLNFLHMAEEKGLRFAVKNIDRPFKLLIIQIKREFSEERHAIEREQEKADMKFLLNEEE